jgi:polyhydroxybutyrate depolymerase
MKLQRRGHGLAFVALGAVALGWSCGGPGSSPTGGGGTTGAAGTSASAGTSGAAGTTGAAGTSAAAGTNGVAGTNGAGGSGTTGVAPSSGCGKPAALTSGRTTIDVAGKAREYILAVPASYDQNKPYRLIFGWHPWGGSAAQTQSMGYFGISTPSGGQAILVAPEGQDYQGMGLGWGNAGGEDVAFYHAMVDRFSAGLCVDQNRIFSTGFSFGAMFSFTLGCTEMSMLRAIAPQAGNAMTSGRCESGTRSVATMAFIGTDDSLLSGHRSAVQTFAQRNGCTTQTTPMTPSWCDGLNTSFQPCSCVQYTGCKTGYPVISCEYKAGHQFAPSSGATLWNFFSQF